MPYTYTLNTVIAATPQQIYAAWLDSLAHTDMTGGEASMSDELGAAVSAWDGYITGRNLELVPEKRIVQSWRTSRFTDAHPDSMVTISLKAAAGGTLLTLVHSNVPDDQRNYEDGGWEANYFAPMRDYFAELAKDLGEDRPRAATKMKPTRAAKAKRASKIAPRKKRQRAKLKAKRAAGSKAKRKGAVRPAKKRISANNSTTRARKSPRQQRAHR